MIGLTLSADQNKVAWVEATSKLTVDCAVGIFIRLMNKNAIVILRNKKDIQTHKLISNTKISVFKCR